MACNACSACPHVTTVGDFTKEDIIKKQQLSQCESCNASGPSLWACLYRDCLYVGCGEAFADHSTQHFHKLCDHSVTLNLTTLRVWCYLCECEVFLENNVPPLPSGGSHSRRLSGARVYVADRDSEDEEGDAAAGGLKPRGLTGLQNLGNTCYMNAALQALSNCPQLTNFFLDCGGFVRSDKKPGLAKSYMRLVREIWHKRRPSYVVPSGIAYGIKMVCPVFRGYSQQDAQEFLRCFLDQLHEELKLEAPTPAVMAVAPAAEVDDQGEESSQSDAEFETCDSGLSSEKSSCGEEPVPDLLLPDEESKELPQRIPEEKAGGDSAPTLASEMDGSAWCRGVPPPSNQGSGAAPRASSSRRRRAAPVMHSIVSDIFDGRILSSVQCLTCDTVSTTRETFQDLSLPIPGRDHLAVLHAQQHGATSGGKGSGTGAAGGSGACSDVYSHQSWLSWMFGWVFSWLWGPSISLQDCLSAFFSADELKGDNMYSCDKCRKLRNGVKFSKVLQLPEVLCIHLKRFRHEVMFSSKISNYVSFPLDGLDMSPFLHQDCPRGVTTYDLTALICHDGTAGSGHYRAYALNCLNEQWYEFDDQYVTSVDPQMVQNCEAYVLFYRKSSDEMVKKRNRTLELMERSRREHGLLNFYVSKQWVNKLNTFAHPGPINNLDFLCMHGGVHPSKAAYVEDLCTVFSQSVWEYLHDSFGGGPACTHLYVCPTCTAEQEALERRRRLEMDTFMALNRDFQSREGPPPATVYALSAAWFKQWEAFLRARQTEPPGPIDNTPICMGKGGQQSLRVGTDYASLSEAMWRFLQGTYGGGPEVVLQAALPQLASMAVRTASTLGARPPTSPPTPAKKLCTAEEQTDARRTGSQQ